MDRIISRKDIRKAWWEYIGIHSDKAIVSMVGFFSTGVIWAHIARHVFNVDFRFWWLNYTSDGDYGPSWFMPKFKRSLLTAFCWWIRNRSWEFYYKYIPVWKKGEVDKIDGVDQFLSIKLTIDKKIMESHEDGIFTKAYKKGKIFGTNYYAYVIDGRTYFNYSFANKFIEIQLGAGGNEYRFWIKL